MSAHDSLVVITGDATDDNAGEDPAVERRPSTLPERAVAFAATTLAGAALVTTVFLATKTAYAATHSLLLAAVIGSIISASATVVVYRYLTHHDPMGYAELVFDGAIVGLCIGAVLVDHHTHVGGALVTGLAYVGWCLFASVNPVGVVECVTYAHWTPMGARRHGIAVTALHAAHQARTTLDDAVDLNAFIRESRDLAAGALGEPGDAYILGRRCGVCGASTTDEPCEDHQPRLLAAHLDMRYLVGEDH